MTLLSAIASYPWLTVALLVVGFGAFALGLVQFSRSDARPQPRYSIRGRPRAVKLQFPSRQGRDETVLALSLAEIWFWNAGRELLLSEPLAIHVADGVCIWAAKITLCSNPAAGFRLGEATPSTLPLHFEYLEGGDGVSIEVLHTGRPDTDIDLTGTAEFAPNPPVLRPRPAVAASREVAPLSRRLAAGLMDATTVLAGFLLILAIRQLAGGWPVFRAITIGVHLGLLVLLALAYGALFSLLDVDSPGTRLASLRLVTFDGAPADSRHRALRLSSKYLSVIGLGFGLLWALADKQRLTWHDRISKTFPSLAGPQLPDG